MSEYLDRKLIRKMIIQEAFILKEERLIAENNYKLARYCAEKETRMLAEGYSREEINEGIIADLLGGAAGMLGDTFKGSITGFLENIEQYIITRILSSIFGSYDPNSFFGAVITNVIENVDVTQIMKYFKDGNCDPIVDTLYAGIVEATAEQGLNKLFGARDDSGFISGAFRESFANALRSAEFSQGIKQSLKSVICNISFGDILNNVTAQLGRLFGRA